LAGWMDDVFHVGWQNIHMRKQLPVLTPLKFADFRYALSSKTADRAEFYKTFSNTIGAESCYPVSSGRGALYLALKSLNQFSDRKDVIVPAYTCPTVPLSVARAGLTVKLCDISAQTLNLDIDSLSQVVDDNTLCIVATHLFGFPCDIARVMEIAGRVGVGVIEDAAQALGARYKNRMVGSFGQMSCFSFGRGKNMTTYEGGVLASNEPEYDGHIKQIFHELERPGVVHNVLIFTKLLAMKLLSRPVPWWFISKLPLGFEPQHHSMDFEITQLSDWQTRFALSVLRRLDMINHTRIENAYYLMDRLQPLKGVVLPKILEDSEPVYLRLPVVIKDIRLRDTIHDELHRRGITASKMYVKPLNRYDYLRGIVPDTECPGAEYVADRILALPTHPLVTKEDMELIVDVFNQFL